jgi:hypothetical protein
LELSLHSEDGFCLRVLPEASATLNAQPFQQARLRNGDLIEAASTKLQFLVMPPTQRDLRVREALTWLGFVCLAALQLYLIHWLMQ